MDRSTSISITDDNNIVINPATEEKQDDIISILWTSYDLLLDDTSTPNITYIWEAIIWSATSSAVWRLKRLDEPTWLNLWWADSNSWFSHIWENRTSFTYSQ